MSFSSKYSSNINTKYTYLSKYFNFDKHNVHNTNKKNNNNLFYTTYSLSEFKVHKKAVTSGASRSLYKLLSPLPIQLKVKKFFFSKKSTSGRSSKGSILCRTKGRSLLHKAKYPYTSKPFRYLTLSFVASIFSTPLKLKMFSLILSSSGTISYTHSTYSHKLFLVSKLYSLFSREGSMSIKTKKFFYLSKFIKIPQLFFLILQLPKHKPVSLLEIFPNKGIQYIKSPGSKALITKIDTVQNLSLVKLPSGVYKVFSAFSMGSVGIVPIPSKNFFKNTNAGFKTRLGRKPLSRGVAKNPVDHPHGGRNKAIRYQRTPWGKTTKFK